MVITKLIRSSRRYLQTLKPNENFYVAVPLSEEDYSRLESYGIHTGGPACIPKPQGQQTEKNAVGSWKVRRDLEKELRAIEREYHTVDWHGNDHYGTCWQRRWCYQREFIPPAEIAFSIESGVLYSSLLVNRDDEWECVKSAINVALEMLGRCEIWTEERTPAIPPVRQIVVPWEILRSGTGAERGWIEYLENVISRKPQAQQKIVLHRHEYLRKLSPDFCVLGKESFWGYIVYGFSSKDLFVFECNEVNNATYVFKGDWLAASQLTKTQVLSANLQEARIIHDEKWSEAVKRLVKDFPKEDIDG